ncbi:hypothetical protein PCASD_01587 [Puccinia coronata f. sp. avenae]|uniref:Uncharacterized protein n=1 Tax=Puccinia coronata f. sp. avenae TaxID=200324 RepID=A0A2N5VID3_9BASI|nr:hypothetical protein PCASD_01587 [Puccinia coronata f. sp. avenae]
MFNRWLLVLLVRCLHVSRSDIRCCAQHFGANRLPAMSRFEAVYEHLPAAVPAAIEISRHILLSPASLFDAPLSRPVLERLQWIKPSLEDERESYLYFNNMVEHGASGRVHDLRTALIHVGSSSWQFCGPEEVEYKIDENCIDSDGLCEVFCRVTVWKARDAGEAIPAKHKMALILKLEAEQAGPFNLKDPPSSWADRLRWKYFDLQDLVTPGLDTRPWFASPIHAASHGNSQTSVNAAERGGQEEDEENYWAGFSSETDDSSLTSGSDALRNQAIPTDPALVARLRNTPLYRSKAPSVSSSRDSDNNPFPQGQEIPGIGPRDIRARLSRTPLYKRAPSVDDSPTAVIHPPSGHVDLDRLLQAAEIVNLPARHPAQIPITHSTSHPPPPAHSRGSHSHPLDPHHESSSSSTTQKDIQDKLVDSLRATFHLYRHCHRTSAPASDPSSLSPGESFLALAHRAVLLESSNQNS